MLRKERPTIIYGGKDALVLRGGRERLRLRHWRALEVVLFGLRGRGHDRGLAWWFGLRLRKCRGHGLSALILHVYLLDLVVRRGRVGILGLRRVRRTWGALRWHSLRRASVEWRVGPVCEAILRWRGLLGRVGLGRSKV